jgi:biofilm protein TabA
MALFGTVDHLSRVLASDTRFHPGFRYLRSLLDPGSPQSQRLRALAAGSKEEIRLERGSLSFDQVYRTRPRGDCSFESHLACIDIQFILEGEEVVDVAPIGELVVSVPYREAKDVIKYLDPGSRNRLCLRAGEAAIFFPEDGHMPGQFQEAPGLVRKTVVKVPVAGE